MTALLPDLAFLPKFDTVEEERLHRKQRLAASFRLFGKFGFDEGVAGHITVRDPEHLDRFWVNPFGMSFKHIRVSDLICVDHTGEVVEGDATVNRAAFAIHSQVHAARPDVIAAAHSHSLYGKAWSSLGPPARPDHAGRVRLLRGPRAVRRLHRRRARRRGGQADRRRARRQQGRDPPQPRAPHRRPLGRRGRVVVHHHGAQLPGAAAGRGRGHAGAHRRGHGAKDVAQVGSPIACYYSFQPLYDDDHREQPDLLE